MLKGALFIGGMSPVCPVERSSIETGEQVSAQLERRYRDAPDAAFPSPYLFSARPFIPPEPLERKENCTLRAEGSHVLLLLRGGVIWKRHMFALEGSDEMVHLPRARVECF